MHLEKQIFYQFAIFVLFIASLSSQAQQVLSVNQFTGSVQASIPLWTVAAGRLNIPIGLVYSTNGVPIDQSGGQAGIGWYVSTGGQISRQIRDLPDDFTNEYASATSRYGWLHNDAASKVNSFVGNYGLSSDCDYTLYDQLEDFGGHNGIDDIYDMEPDIFRVSVPGHLSVSFTFNESGGPVLFDNQQVSITTLKDADSLITEFIVTTIDQTVYRFKKHTSVFTSIINDPGQNNIEEYKREYFSHQRGQYYTQSWSLRKITSAYGEEINFIYGYGNNIYLNDGSSTGTSSDDSDDFKTHYYDESTDSYLTENQFTLKKVYISEGHLSAIDTKWERVTIGQNGVILPIGNYKFKYPVVTDIQVLDKRTKETHKAYEFIYNAVRNNEASNEFYSHLYLYNLVLSKGGNKGKYSFNYHGVSGNSSLFTDRDSPDKDQYGFYSPRSTELPVRKQFLFPEVEPNEKIGFRPAIGYSGEYVDTPGFESDKPSVSRVSLGALTEVRLPLGGTERITYELNRYYDSLSRQDEYGGGIRVKQIRLYDGVNYKNDIELTYDYSTENGNSSGVLMYKPTFYKFNPFQYQLNQSHNYYPDLVNGGLKSSEVFKRQLTFSDIDLSENDHPGYTVGYRQCTVSKAGFGSTTTHFNLLKSLEDAYKVLDGGMKIAPNLASSENCLSGLDTNDYLPLNHSLIFRFNGLPAQVTQFDESGNKVKNVIHQYDTVGSPIPVYGMKSKHLKLKTSSTGITDGFRYGTYSIDHNTKLVKSQTINQSFDPSNDNYKEEKIEYYYDALGRLTSQKITDVEEVVYKVKLKYPDSYDINLPFSQRSQEVQAISKLVEKGQIYIPVETWNTIRVGNDDLTISGKLTTWEYNPELDRVYPKSSFQLQLSNPISDFDSSYIQENTNASLEISDRYLKLNTILSWNEYGTAISSVARGEVKSYIRYSNNGKYVSAIFNGATESEIVFADYESENSDLFIYPTPTGNIDPIPGRVIGFGQPLSQAKKVYSFNAESLDYFFSCWVKSENSETLTIKVVKDGTVTFSENINIQAGGEWIYYSAPVSVSTGQQNLEIHSSDDIVIDEVALFPEHTSFAYTHFGTNGRKLAETTSSGITTYYEYDGSGRLVAVRDYERNIVKVFEYHTIDDFIITTGDDLYLGYDAPLKKGQPGRFFIDSEDCFSFKWNVQSLSGGYDPATLYDFTNPTATTVSNEYYHTFSDSGRYILAVKMTCGGEDVIKTKSFRVGEAPLDIDLCYDRATDIDLCAPDQDSYITTECSQNRVEDVVHLEVTINGGLGSYKVEWYVASSSSGTISGFPVGSQKIGEGTSIGISNYYDKYVHYKVIDETTKEWTEGPKVFFNAYQSQSCQE